MSKQIQTKIEILEITYISHIQYNTNSAKRQLTSYETNNISQIFCQNNFRNQVYFFKMCNLSTNSADPNTKTHLTVGI